MDFETGLYKDNCSDYLRAKLSLKAKLRPTDKKVKVVRKEKYNSGQIQLSQLEQYLLITKQVKSIESLQKILSIVKGIVADIDKSFAPEAVLYILNLFIDVPQILTAHHDQLKQKFGQIPFQAASSLHSAVKEFQSITEICVPPDTSGNKYPFYITKVPALYTFNKKVQDCARSAEEKQKKSHKTTEFSMLYNGKSVNGQASANNIPEENILKELTKYNTSPDENEVFVQQVLKIISNPKADLKKDLVKYVGYDNVYLYSFILNNKSKLTKYASFGASGKGITQQPSYGVQVTVQSKKERELLKALKKVEKKRKTGDVAYMDEYQDIKTEHEIVARTPILKKAPAVQQPNFPFVFEATKEISQRISISTDLHKITPTYEQFIVPAVSKSTLPELPPHINIQETFDEIGKVIFRDVKTLNTIQTIVFPIGYLTNENMLICAPTGAGKTNIAMLSIAHQINQHTIDGNIQHNQFKIVYVVPMKALAAEVTANFGKKLAPLGIVVKELTGDMQLTVREVKETQILVVTPEKWDVVTRKGTDTGILDCLRLMIIDEVHLLHGDRGPVIEALVARTIRLVEANQSMIRIVGLSATLPNYLDVAKFLKVNPYRGLFFFDGRFRPVPLTQKFVGVKASRGMQQMNEMDNICYENVVEFLQKGHQCMVFVHARKMTVHTANVLKEKALAANQKQLFEPPPTALRVQAMKQFGKSSNKMLAELVSNGFGVHHAGLQRTDRNLIEKYFREGLIKVLVCTATLAWGVNLPAHGVIIKGTDIYDSKRGQFVPLDILDVLQIFGRAGRPQYDTSGVGVIITTHTMLQHYLRLLTLKVPIESSFLDRLPDHLNAEIVLGTVANVDEGVKWLSYTYLHQRLFGNPLAYGVNVGDLMEDTTLYHERRKFILTAALGLDKSRMIRFNKDIEEFTSTDLGRTASHYYINYDTVQLFNNCIEPFMTEKELLDMIAQADEFTQLKVRQDEMDELEWLLGECELAVFGGISTIPGKVNVLMQTYLSRGFINNFSMVSDVAYVAQNVVRICRALFDIALHQNNPTLAGRCLMLCKMFELQQWDFQSPFRQFTVIGGETIGKIEKHNITIERAREDDVNNLAFLIRSPRAAELIQKCALEYPQVEVESSMQPITRTVLRVKIAIKGNFYWNDRVHGKVSESFWLWVEDPDNNTMYYSERFTISKFNVIQKEAVDMAFTVPLAEPLPSQYLVRITSERWLACSHTHILSFRDLILPDSYPPHTDLLELQPLPVKALKNTKFQSLYKFSHFNPIQTQIFHCLYHTDHNVLVGAPTGSGKTIIAELAVLRMFSKFPGQKVVYIAPLKALVRERIKDWKDRFGKALKKNVIELTGDVSPNLRDIQKAHVIVTTPEKWDGLSRSWMTRNYVKQVGLIIIDEIHLLGEDRGPVLEVIVSRTNFIAANTTRKLRIVGLSTAMANAKDLANWLGIKSMGLYNFRPSVRPVPLQVHISGHPGKHYCPRMISMNKPTYQAIRAHAFDSPALVFVSSRRQTKLTATDLISYLATDTDSKQWLHMDEQDMDHIVKSVRDNNLKLCLPFGIGLHHAGLSDHDRQITEELFVNQRIQVLIATSTLAWGVNFPAHLVVIKGTEYFDAKTHRYVDMPITDVLQMMGRAGRPQFDTSGVAVVLVHDIKKNFYKKFLYEPFPVESNLLQVLPDHINAEIVAGTIKSKSDLVEYLTWTYFFRRLLQNPSYYNLPGLEKENINCYLNELSDATLSKLIESHCLDFNEDEGTFASSHLGQVASYYYLSNETMKFFHENMKRDLELDELLLILSYANEYAEVPVRHNEDILNREFVKHCRIDCGDFDSPHIKTFLLLQGHFSRLEMPVHDYVTDLKGVLDQAQRIIQAMIDISASNEWLSCTIRLQQMLQMIVQACWLDDSLFLTMCDLQPVILDRLQEVWETNYSQLNQDILHNIKQAHRNDQHKFVELLTSICGPDATAKIVNFLNILPILRIQMHVEDTTTQKMEKVDLRQSKANKATMVADREYSFHLKITRECKKKSLSVPAPHFPKNKDENWFINLGLKSPNTLICLKRAVVQGTKKIKLSFVAPKRPGRYTLSFYFISDSYVGMDQQYDIDLFVTN